MDNSLHQVQELASILYTSLNTPFSLKLKSLMEAGEWKALATATLEPSSYQCPIAFRKDAIAHGFIRKLDSLPTGIDLHAESVKTFYACENSCAKTNARLSRFIPDRQHSLEASDVPKLDFIHLVREKMSSLLGPLPRDLSPKLGKGSTFYDRGSSITIPHKFASRPCRTNAAWWTDSYLFNTAWGLATLVDHPTTSAPLVERGNRFLSVQKDATKNRGICVEPSMNLAFQLSVGSFLKGRLKTVGLDLKKLQFIHRKLAQKASLDGSQATIDLSNASDTISSTTVKLLLPEMWFDLLSDLRSPFTYVEGKWCRLEKFSSMGNGFTFELETLIFLSIALACADVLGSKDQFSLIRNRDVSVYGDDIIVKTEYGKLVVDALRFFGFETNSKKTFLEGPFRESCGGDFFLGQDVRPYQLKKVPNDASSWIATANAVRKLGRSDNSDHPWFSNLHLVWLNCLNNIPSSVRVLRGPPSLGDVVIHDISSTWITKVILDHDGGYTGLRSIRGYAPVSKAIKLSQFSSHVQLASALYGVPSTGPIPRDSVSGYKKRWFPLLEEV